MKSIINYINEKLKINSQDIDLGYKYFPKDQYELRELISDHILAQAKETHTSVDLSDIDVSKITDMSKLFYKFDYLEKINVSGWDISNVETLESCFGEMKNLKEINGLDDWDLSKVKNINAMFYKCKSLTKLDLSGWDTKSVTSMDAVFSYCENLKEIIYSGVCADLCVMDFARTYARYLDEINKDVKLFVVKSTIDTFDAPNHNRYEWNENVHIFTNEIGIYEYEDIDIYGYGFNDFYLRENKIKNLKNFQNPIDKSF